MTATFGDARLPKRFWEKLTIDANDCWLFGGWLDNGYGRFSVRGVDTRAHRLAWETLVGPIPTGLVIDHLCRVRSCCNPAHLEPVTHQVNILRGEAPSANLARRTHCSEGHELLGENLVKHMLPARRKCRICHLAEKRKQYHRSVERKAA